MKFKVVGKHDNKMSGVPQIVEALKNLGHEIVEENADVIWHPTGFFDELFDIAPLHPNAKLVGTLLDADPTNPNWPVEKAKSQLNRLHVRTTISQTARKQIQDRTGIDTKVIYYPIKPIEYKPAYRGLDFVVVGRIYSPNKRFSLISNFLQTISYDPENILVVGPERAPFGFVGGIVDNETLSEIYNSTRHLLFFSSHEGLGLSPIEAICGGCIPLLCNDNPCAQEFGLDDFAADPNPVALAKKLKDMTENRDFYLKKMDELRSVFLKQFSAESVAHNLIEAINN